MFKLIAVRKSSRVEQVFPSFLEANNQAKSLASEGFTVQILPHACALSYGAPNE